VSLNLECRQRLGQRQPPSHARPPRTTRQSHRPRASDRTIVGILDPRWAGRASHRHGRSFDGIMNRSGPANFTGCHGHIGAGRRRELLLPVSGENFFLTSPFIELQGALQSTARMGRREARQVAVCVDRPSHFPFALRPKAVFGRRGALPPVLPINRRTSNPSVSIPRQPKSTPAPRRAVAPRGPCRRSRTLKAAVRARRPPKAAAHGSGGFTRAAIGRPVAR
jgi:hypothetical protein